MKELVAYIVKSLCTYPDDVQISESVDGDVTIIHVSVNAEDMGRVIGKGGRIASSIRAIVKSMSSKERKKYVVKFGE